MKAATELQSTVCCLAEEHRIMNLCIVPVNSNKVLEVEAYLARAPIKVQIKSLVPLLYPLSTTPVHHPISS